MVEQFVMQINIYTFTGERGNPIEISFTFNSTNKELKGFTPSPATDKRQAELNKNWMELGT
jgi:hypothetical protein